MKTTSPTREVKVVTGDGRQLAMETALQAIRKQFGAGSIMLLGEQDRQAVEIISTGNIAIDVALGVGGIPRGRVTEVYGTESCGKTTLALHVIAEAQKSGGTAALIDVEHALDPAYAQALGIDIRKLIIAQPDTGEEALEIMDALVRSGALDVVVLDSVAALVPKAEIDGDMGDSHMGLQARLMSQALRKLTGSVGKTNTAIIFINQIREKIGVMYGSPETTPGGRALRFYASVRLQVSPSDMIKQGTAVTGRTVKVKVTKNKVSPPFRVAEVDIMFGSGMSRAGSALDLAVTLKLIEKAGSWFTYADTRIGQGRENAKKYIEDNADVLAQIEGMIRDSSAGGTLLTIGKADDGDE